MASKILGYTSSSLTRYQLSRLCFMYVNCSWFFETLRFSCKFVKRKRENTHTRSRDDAAVHILCWGSVYFKSAHSPALLTMAVASSRPKPNLWLKWNPAPLTFHPSSRGEVFKAVCTIKSCTSRHVNLGLKYIFVTLSFRLTIPLHKSYIRKESNLRVCTLKE